MADDRRAYWVRLDGDWYSNPKFLRLKRDRKFRAAWIYFAGLGWSGRNKQGGFIPDYALEEIGAAPGDVKALIDVGLWFPGINSDGDDGYEVNDWAEYQETTATQKQRSERAEKANCKRWHTEGSKKCRHC